MKMEPRRQAESGEFLWLISLSDLMILLFIFFVVLFSFTYKRLKESDFKQIVATLRNEKPPENPIDQVGGRFRDWVQKEKLADLIDVKSTDDSVSVEIKDKLLFTSGEATPNFQGIAVLRRLAKVLEKVPDPYRIGIEGHTDDSPISSRTTRDNWELSSQRALAVLYSLDLNRETLGRSIVMAYGEMKPVVPNRDKNGRPIPANQSKNRRVTLKIF